MSQEKNENLNRLDVYRRRMKFSAGHVARLLGHKNSSPLSKYEQGQRMPSLENALRLGIILRVPVEFLFYSLNDQLRREIRAEEERQALPTQQALF